MWTLVNKNSRVRGKSIEVGESSATIKFANGFYALGDLSVPQDPVDRGPCYSHSSYSTLLYIYFKETSFYFF